MPKPRKLTHGEGTAYEMRPGLWRAQAVINGRRRSASGRNKTEAIAALDELRKRIAAADGKADDEVVAVPRLGAWLVEWRDVLAPEGSDNTTANRTWAIGHLAPLSAVPLDKLTSADVRDVLASKAGKLGAKSLERIRSVLYGALNAAEAEGLITHNVAAGRLVPIPRKARKTAERRALSEAEARGMLAAAAEDRDGIAVVLGIAAGMRPGEVAGLRWSGVDWDASTVTVTEMRRREPNGSLTFCDPKADSARTLAVSAPVMDALRSHKAAQAGRGHWAANGLVLATRNGTPVDPSNHRRIVRRIAKAAGVFWNPTPNELRHTAISHAIENGASLSEAADMAGHANERMVTRTYRHKVRGAVSTANRLASLFDAEAVAAAP
jgi:integrase